jgi:cyclopropane fatty-acyl-phospholipid synthase-like methyltransferase
MDARKEIVRRGYDAVAAHYAAARRVGDREAAWLKRFRALLPAGAHVLDLGCGNGEPQMAGMLADGLRVTGVDFSHEQVVRARARCPSATIIESDVTAVDFPAGTFQGVLAYDSLFHVPRAEHTALFGRIRHWLVEGGSALLTLAFVPPGREGELHTDHLGAPTFYDAWPLETSIAALQNAGLSVVDRDVLPNGPEVGVEGGHVIVLARA